MSFDLDKFTVEPSVELLNLGKKTDLLNLAKLNRTEQNRTEQNINLFMTCTQNTSSIIQI